MPEERTTSSTGGQKGVKLARFDLIPAGPLRELAEHYGRGARKYAPNQWRAGYEWGKSIAALLRHMNDFQAGKDYDVCSNEPDNCKWLQDVEYEPDTCENHTGSHHMAAIAWHAFLLLEFKDTHPEHDDRYLPGAESETESETGVGTDTFHPILGPKRDKIVWKNDHNKRLVVAKKHMVYFSTNQRLCEVERRGDWEWVRPEHSSFLPTKSCESCLKILRELLK